MSSQWVVVSDTDPGIKYTGHWSVINVGGALGNGSDGLTSSWQNTSHSFRSTGFDDLGNFTYTFEGSKVAVYGPSYTFNSTSSESGSSPLVWKCVVDDGTSEKFTIPDSTPFGQFQTWASYCDTESLKDGPHVLTVTVGGGSTFYLDSIRFVPSTNVELVSNTTLLIESTSPGFKYAPQWEDFGTVKMLRNSTGGVNKSALFMNYNGSAISWHALSKSSIIAYNSTYHPTGVLNASGIISGSYQVDGSAKVPFKLDMSSRNMTQEFNSFNNVLFTTPTIEVGSHNLSVFYRAEISDAPLTLDFLTVKDAFGITSPSNIHKDHKGATIGGAIGGIVGAILLALLAYFSARRHYHNRWGSRPKSYHGSF